jgi:serum/glucocorticoid-regulated kinase 2
VSRLHLPSKCNNPNSH